MTSEEVVERMRLVLIDLKENHVKNNPAACQKIDDVVKLVGVVPLPKLEFPVKVLDSTGYDLVETPSEVAKEPTSFEEESNG